jgi:hypothetical protein
VTNFYIKIAKEAGNSRISIPLIPSNTLMGICLGSHEKPAKLNLVTFFPFDYKIIVMRPDLNGKNIDKLKSLCYTLFAQKQKETFYDTLRRALF